MRKHGGTPSRRDKHVTLAAISPPGVAWGRFVGAQQSGPAGFKPPPLFTRGASSSSSQGRRQGEPRGASPRRSAPTYLPTSVGPGFLWFVCLCVGAAGCRWHAPVWDVVGWRSSPCRVPVLVCPVWCPVAILTCLGGILCRWCCGAGLGWFFFLPGCGGVGICGCAVNQIGISPSINKTCVR